jgi:TP901 family phage tail tape measure protein
VARSIVDVFARLLADDTGFEADVVRKAQKAGDKAGMSMGQAIAAGVSRSATQIGQTLGNIGQNLSRTGRSLSTNLTLPLVAAGAAVTHFALDFDTTMRQVVGLTDITAEEIDGVREKILALGPAVGKGPQELGEAFYFIASAGFKANEALEVLETSAKASAAGLGETQTIAQLLGGVINAYGRENITAARAADILTEAVSQGTAEAAGLATVLGNVVPGAAALGVSFDQVTAALAGMTLVGVGVEEAATSLIQIFSSLQKPTTQAEEALRGMGLSSAELRRQLRDEGLLATLRTLEERFAGNETAAAAVFGNIRALRGVTALLTLDTDQLNAVFATVEDSAGRLAQAYEETEGPQREVDRAMAQLNVTAIELGADVLPVVVEGLQGLADGARKLGTWWRGLDADTRQAIVQFLSFAAMAGPVLLIIGKLVGAVGALFKVVGLLAGPKGLAALPGRLSALLRVATRIGPWLLLIDTLMKLPAAFDAVGDAIDGFAKGAPLKVVKALKQLNDAMPGIFNPFHDATEDMLNRLESDLEEKMPDVASSMTVGWAEAWQAVGRTTQEGTDLVGRVLADGSVEVGDGATTGIEDPIVAAIAEARQQVAQTTLDLIQDLANNLATGPGEIEDEMQAIIDALVDPFTTAERIAQIRGELINGALTTALTSDDPKLEADTFTKINDWLHQWELAEPRIFDIGSGFLPSLTEGMNTNLQTAVDWVTQNMGIDFANQFDLADQLEAMGYDGLAAFVRGNEQARVDKLTAEGAARKAQLQLQWNDERQAAYDAGQGVGTFFANGLNSMGSYLNQKAKDFREYGTRILRYQESPPYTGIRKIGENVGQFWTEAIGGGIRAALPQLATAAGQAAGALAITPGMTGLASYPAQNLATPMTAPGLAPAGQISAGDTYNYNLNVSGRLDVDEGQDALDELRRLQTLSLRPGG